MKNYIKTDELLLKRINDKNLNSCIEEMMNIMDKKEIKEKYPEIVENDLDMTTMVKKVISIELEKPDSNVFYIVDKDKDFVGIANILSSYPKTEVDLWVANKENKNQMKYNLMETLRESIGEDNLVYIIEFKIKTQKNEVKNVLFENKNFDRFRFEKLKAKGKIAVEAA